MSTIHSSHTGQLGAAARKPVPPDVVPPLGAGPGGRRVRHEARDQVAVMVFSALASCGVAVLLMVLVQVAG